MRAMVLQKARADFVLEERPVPEPGVGEVLVRMHACGVCHGDEIAKNGFPGVPYPHVAGHEIAGEVAALGEGVSDWKIGDRVGIGWWGGSCGDCEFCLRGRLTLCPNMTIPGINVDGGYADYVVVRSIALARIPDSISLAEAAPFMCAGVTTFHAIRRSGAPGGSRVAIQGLGGLGHLAVQFAAKLGYETIAIARGPEKQRLAEQLGARHYIDSNARDPAEALQRLGGVDLLVSTASSAQALGTVFGGVRSGGKLITLGGSMEPIPIAPLALIPGEREILGRKTGTAADSQDTMNFAARTGVRAMIETMPLEDANEAFARMHAGDARYRMVLLTSGVTTAGR